jgi:hypothetical protein
MAGHVPGVPPVLASPPLPPATAPEPDWFRPLPEPLPLALPLAAPPEPPVPAAVDPVVVGVVELVEVVVDAGAVDAVVGGTWAADTDGDEVVAPPDLAVVVVAPGPDPTSDDESSRTTAAPTIPVANNATRMTPSTRIRFRLRSVHLGRDRQAARQANRSRPPGRRSSPELVAGPVRRTIDFIADA